jgi:broad-specificity NMP kinase
MSKVFITGAGGVGKSTIIKDLAERGFSAYDTDSISGATRLQDKAGNDKAWPAGYIDWSEYRWNWQRPKINQLLASEETVFLGAIPSNWKEFVDEFDTIIALRVDSGLQEQRLKDRNIHIYGQGEQNIADNIASQAQLLRELTAEGAKIVDNSHPIDQVVDEILVLSHVDR